MTDKAWAMLKPSLGDRDLCSFVVWRRLNDKISERERKYNGKLDF